jgi:hypothetical protein
VVIARGRETGPSNTLEVIMIDAFIGGVMTLIVLFFLFAGVVLLIEAVPVIGALLLIPFLLLVVAAISSFTRN